MQGSVCSLTGISPPDGYNYEFLIRSNCIWLLKKFSGLDTPQIREVIEQESFDAVLVNGWHYKSAWQTMRECWKTRTPVMVLK